MPDASAIARTMHEVIEPITSVAFFAPEAFQAWADLGLEPLSGYFVGRAAPLGRCSTATVRATFFNFSAPTVAAAWDGAWEATTPEDVLATQARAMQAMFERLGAPTDGVAEATDLAYAAVAGLATDGRPLAAANQALPRRDTPFGDLYQALTTLREYRGDGHVALLVAAGLDGVDAVVCNKLWAGRPSRRFSQGSRGITDEQWDRAAANLVARGWSDGQDLTDAGRAARDEIERRTNELDAAPWQVLGPDGSRRLFELLLPVAKAAARGFPKPYELAVAFPG